MQVKVVFTEQDATKFVSMARDLLAIADDVLHSDRLADIVLLLDGHDLGREVY